MHAVLLCFQTREVPEGKQTREYPARREGTTLAKHRELDVRVVELSDVGTLAISSLHNCCLDDVQLVAADSVPGRHLRVHLFHSAVESQVAVLLVHVVVSCTRLVADPNTEVLCGCGLLLEDL
jgi:hypothetical protein